VSTKVKTEALDRLIEALSPALASELDRIVQEIRQGLENEFQLRLKNAFHEGETAGGAAAQVQVERAIEQAREEARRQVAGEFEKQIKKISEESSKLEETLSQLTKDWSDERSKFQKEVERWRTFAEIQQQLAEAVSQPEMLSRFIRLAQPFAEGLALYVSKADGLALWKSKGNGVFPQIISQQTTDPESYFHVISVRGKTVAAICAGPPFKSDALDFLAASLERGIEMYGLKLRAAIPKS